MVGLGARPVVVYGTAQKKRMRGVTKYLVLNANGLLKQKYYRKGLKLSQLLSTTPYNW